MRGSLPAPPRADSEEPLSSQAALYPELFPQSPDPGQTRVHPRHHDGKSMEEPRPGSLTPSGNPADGNKGKRVIRDWLSKARSHFLPVCSRQRVCKEERAERDSGGAVGLKIRLEVTPHQNPVP